MNTQHYYTYGKSSNSPISGVQALFSDGTFLGVTRVRVVMLTRQYLLMQYICCDHTLSQYYSDAVDGPCVTIILIVDDVSSPWHFPPRPNSGSFTLPQSGHDYPANEVIKYFTFLHNVI